MQPEAAVAGNDSEIASVLPSEDRAAAEPPVSASLATLDYAAQFEASGHLEPLMRFKQALAL